MKDFCTVATADNQQDGSGWILHTVNNLSEIITGSEMVNIRIDPFYKLTNIKELLNIL